MSDNELTNFDLDKLYSLSNISGDLIPSKSNIITTYKNIMIRHRLRTMILIFLMVMDMLFYFIDGVQVLLIGCQLLEIKIMK